MIHIHITGSGSFVVQAMIAKLLGEQGLRISQWTEVRSRREQKNIARRKKMRDYAVLITIAEKEP